MDTVHISYALHESSPAHHPTQFTPAQRIQRSLLAVLEKKTLLWLARHTPDVVQSDHLTILGAVAMLLAGACYYWSRTQPAALLLVILFLALNWLGDSLDGTLARYRNRQRPRYGFYIDHLLDALGASFLLAGLALSGFMHPAVAVGLLVAYLLLSIEACLATYTLAKFTLSFFKVSPTELRLLLALGNVALFFHPIVHLGSRNLRLLDLGGAIGIAGMCAVLLLSSVSNTRLLLRQERIR